MDLFDALMTRRSIRAFTHDPVGDEAVEQILRAGMAAPSAGNEQPWEFLLVTDRATLEGIAHAHPYAEMVGQAPLAVVVCGNRSRIRHQDFWIQDLAAATENMLLAIHALGLGSVWVGVYPRAKRVAEIRSVLPLPEEIIPFAVLPIGYPAEGKPPEDRFDERRIHHEQWKEQ